MEDSEDEFNEDASRSYHAPNESVTHLTMASNTKTHWVVKSYDDHSKSAKYRAADMNPEDRIDPKHQAQACQWIEDLMGIKINNKLPPKFSTIDEHEEKDYIDPEERAQGMTMTLSMYDMYNVQSI